MDDYSRIALIIRYLDEHRLEQPDLDRLAAVAGLGRFTLHKLFVRWAGVTPKAFLQCLTVSHARELLARGRDVLGASIEAGLSGPGRLHDLTVRLEAASPGELKSGGAGWTIEAGVAETPFGSCRVAEGPRGVCDLAFVDSRERGPAEAALREAWPAAELRWSDAAARRIARRVFEPGAEPAFGGERPLRAFVRGSAFQVRVWRALLAVPPGAAVSYGALARALDPDGGSGAARAVGSAVARNPLAGLIPCHRVIRETGIVGEYRWGADRKRAMLAWESRRDAGCEAVGAPEPER